MASEWIKFEKATSDKPEVWAIACALNVDPDAVVGKLLRVWAWFDEQTENGNAPSVTKMLLDRKVGVTGFCDAVISAGWMQEKDNAITLPNFERHNGETAKKRALGKNRTEKHRSNADVTPQPLQESQTSNAPSVTDALPEEEKKRKEKTLTENPPESGKPDPCPHQAIVDEYHRILPELAGIRDITDKRKTALRARWRSHKRFQNLDWWRDFFETVRESDFLMGRIPGKSWQADFDFLIRSDKFQKIIEGGYQNGGVQ
jgi:hypothetical protein